MSEVSEERQVKANDSSNSDHSSSSEDSGSSGESQMILKDLDTKDNAETSEVLEGVEPTEVRPLFPQAQQKAGPGYSGLPVQPYYAQPIYNAPSVVSADGQPSYPARYPPSQPIYPVRYHQPSDPRYPVQYPSDPRYPVQYAPSQPVAPTQNANLQSGYGVESPPHPQVLELQQASSTEAPNPTPKEQMANLRNQFIRKVFSLLLIQLFVTFGWVALVTTVQSLQYFVRHTIPLLVICWFLVLAIVILVFCTKKWAKEYPYNYLGLFSFVSSRQTIFQSYVVGWICSLYSPESVLACCLICLGITFALMIYALKVNSRQTKEDFTSKTAIAVVIIAAIVFFAIGISFSYSSPGYTVAAFFIACIFGITIVFDVQAIAGGRYEEISLDHYVIATLMLYIDIMGMFIYLLAYLGKKA
jgi:FtsH-binding integral membrane protein